MVMRMMTGRGGQDKPKKEWTLKKLRAYSTEVYVSQMSDANIRHYDGDVAANRPHGMGIALYHDGSRYAGGWENGAKHGDGVWEHPEQGSFDGQWKANVYHGQGKRVYGDGSVFIGDWVDGARHGMGTLSTREWKYEGTWERDRPCGRECKWHSLSTMRIITTPGGGTAEGAAPFPIEIFVADRKYGGVRSYEGSLIPDKGRHGKGRTEYRNGAIYQGDYYENVRKGKGKFLYENGDKYEGYWVRDVRHGRGQMVYACGGRYDGEWKVDMMCGKGYREYPNGDKYSGEWHDNQISGRGTMTYRNGDEYNGEWKTGVRHGKGTFKFHKQGAEYCGPLINGLIHTGEDACGKMVYASGDVYVGCFVKGERTRGMMWLPSGDVYCGAWRYDKFHGKGLMWYADGAFYCGSWARGKRSGKGAQRFADGSEFAGDYADDKRSGAGILQRPDNVIVHGSWEVDNPTVCYTGAWRNHFYEGSGEYVYATGSKYFGTWREGLKTGAGEILFQDGAVYQGGMKADIPHGPGVLRYPNKSLYKGVWNRGLKHGHGLLCDVANKNAFVGQWVCDERTGPGTYFHNDGAVVIEGVWSAGKLFGEVMLHYTKAKRVVRCDYYGGVEVSAVGGANEALQQLPPLAATSPRGTRTSPGAQTSASDVRAASITLNSPSNAARRKTSSAVAKDKEKNGNGATGGNNSGGSPAPPLLDSQRALPSDADIAANAKLCSACGEKFTMTRWQHSCIGCHFAFCSTCLKDVRYHKQFAPFSTDTIPSHERFIEGKACAGCASAAAVGVTVATIWDLERGQCIVGTIVDTQFTGNVVRHFRNKDVYVGGMLRDREHGVGNYLYHATGEEFLGTFREGKRSGVGFMLFTDNTVQEAVYRDGLARLVTYHGLAEKRVRNGITVSIERSGLGLATYENGDRYNGAHKGGLRHGLGVMTYFKGGEYIGEWAHGKRHGRGRMTCANGEVHTGLWRNDQRHGRGLLETAEQYLEGDWHHDKSNGDMIHRWKATGDLEVRCYLAGEEKQDVFAVPLMVADASSDVCSGCNKTFTFLRRRHHCRGCGKLFCGECSPATAVFPPHFGHKDPNARACLACKDIFARGRRARIRYLRSDNTVRVGFLPGVACLLPRDPSFRPSLAMMPVDDGTTVYPRDGKILANAAGAVIDCTGKEVKTDTQYLQYFNDVCKISGAGLTMPFRRLDTAIESARKSPNHAAADNEIEPIQAIVGEVITTYVPFDPAAVAAASPGRAYVPPTRPQVPVTPDPPPAMPAAPTIVPSDEFKKGIQKRMDAAAQQDGQADGVRRVQLTVAPPECPPKGQYKPPEWTFYGGLEKDTIKDTRHACPASSADIAPAKQHAALREAIEKEERETAGAGAADAKTPGMLRSGLQTVAKPFTATAQAVAGVATTVVATPVNAVTSVVKTKPPPVNPPEGPCLPSPIPTNINAASPAFHGAAWGDDISPRRPSLDVDAAAAAAAPPTATADAPAETREAPAADVGAAEGGEDVSPTLARQDSFHAWGNEGGEADADADADDGPGDLQHSLSNANVTKRDSVENSPADDALNLSIASFNQADGDPFSPFAPSFTKPGTPGSAAQDPPAAGVEPVALVLSPERRASEGGVSQPPPVPPPAMGEGAEHTTDGAATASDAGEGEEPDVDTPRAAGAGEGGGAGVEAVAAPEPTSACSPVEVAAEGEAHGDEERGRHTPDPMDPADAELMAAMQSDAAATTATPDTTAAVADDSTAPAAMDGTGDAAATASEPAPQSSADAAAHVDPQGDVDTHSEASATADAAAHAAGVEEGGA